MKILVPIQAIWFSETRDTAIFLKLCRFDEVTLSIFINDDRDFKWRNFQLETCYELDELVTELIL